MNNTVCLCMNFFTKNLIIAIILKFLWMSWGISQDASHEVGERLRRLGREIKKIYFRAGIIWLVRLPHRVKTFEEPLGTLSKWTVPSITLKTDQLTFLQNPKYWMSSSHFSLIMFVYVRVGYIKQRECCSVRSVIWCDLKMNIEKWNIVT